MVPTNLDAPLIKPFSINTPNLQNFQANSSINASGFP